MKQSLNHFRDDIKGKTVGFLGVGVSNIPVMKLLAKFGAKIIARDKNEAVKEKIADIPHVTYYLGENYLDDIKEDMLFKTPGIRYDMGALNEARKNGVIVTSEMEVLFSLCPAKIIAVTGSDGKTTTTTLIAKILEKSGYHVILGGNIGKCVLGDIENIKKDDVVVLELSSFQLHTMTMGPDIAVVTNVSPNHLDWHKDMQEYIDAKENIVLNQREDSLTVLNEDNEITAEFKKDVKGKLRTFSYNKEVENGVYQKDGTIYVDGKELMREDDIAIVGRHNVENYMAAIAATYDMVSPEDILYVAKNFGGVEHRIEFVREIDGVKYYNDSIATTPTRTMAGLKAFSQKVILIAGGYDKKVSFEPVARLIPSHVKELILIGQTANIIETEVRKISDKEPNITHCGTFKEAVDTAKSFAKKGDVVLLSPACASFGMFKNYEQRGEMFKEMVNHF